MTTTKRIKIYFSYDGAHFRGWQRQKNTKNTVQEVLENRFSQLVNSRMSLMPSGRTDAGVHARIQVAHANLPEESAKRFSDEKGSFSKLILSLNSILPEDIRIFFIEEVPSDFHAIRCIKQKTYLYFIHQSPVNWPVLRDYTWQLRLPLDWKAVLQGTQHLVGTHDFKALCSADASVKTTVRTVYEARWDQIHYNGQPSQQGQIYVFRITGSGFLKYMVRSIVGTLVYIGHKKASPDLIADLLKTKDRQLAGPTAPAKGLWLWDIAY